MNLIFTIILQNSESNNQNDEMKTTTFSVYQGLSVNRFPKNVKVVTFVLIVVNTGLLGKVKIVISNLR